jgi:hypothetical protein
VKGWEMTFQTNGIQRQAGVNILISDKADLIPKLREIKKVTVSTNGNNSLRRFNGYNYLHTEYWCTKFY